MNVVALVEVAAGIKRIIQAANNESEDDTRDRVLALIEASPWSEEVRVFRQTELASAYFQNRHPVSITDAFAEALDLQSARLNRGTLNINTFEAMRALKLFSAALFWIAISPDPADDYLAYLLGFSSRGGTGSPDHEYRPSWARGLRSTKSRP